METLNASYAIGTNSKKSLWAGRIISTLCILFLLIDSIMKVLMTAPSVEGSIQIGWPEHSIFGAGVVLLACTILYIIPHTSILGAILLTGYLGGATAIMVRIGQPFYFSVIFGVLLWAGLYLRDKNLRKLIPFRKVEEE